MSKNRSLTLQENLLNDSRFSPSGNGSRPDGGDTTNTVIVNTQPTSAQKWWAAILFGFIFALISSPLSYYGTNFFFTRLGGAKTTIGPGPTLLGLLIHTIVFTLVVRLILW